MHDIILIGAGVVVGSFIPSVGRRIKAFFVKESAVVKTSVAKKL